MIKDDVVLLTMTMDAGKGIPGSTIRWALRENFAQFEKVVVVDGCLTEEAKAFYDQFRNVQVIDSPWTDSYVKQYEVATETLKKGQWGLWLDDDEICSPELLSGLMKNDWKFSSKNLDIIKLPCQLYLTENGQDYFAAENPPKKIFKDQWTKNILFQKNEELWFKHFGSHVIPMNKNGRFEYIPLPYYHMKSLQSFVYNDVWQAFLSPEGQHYNQIQSKYFKMFTSYYKTTKDFKEATKKGSWPVTLKKFAWDNRREYNSPISRLSWVYFILEGHEMPEKDEFMTWNNVKQFVQSQDVMSLYNENKNNNIGIKIDEVRK